MNNDAANQLGNWVAPVNKSFCRIRITGFCREALEECIDSGKLKSYRFSKDMLNVGDLILNQRVPASRVAADLGVSRQRVHVILKGFMSRMERLYILDYEYADRSRAKIFSLPDSIGLDIRVRRMSVSDVLALGDKFGAIRGEEDYQVIQVSLPLAALLLARCKMDSEMVIQLVRMRNLNLEPEDMPEHLKPKRGFGDPMITLQENLGRYAYMTPPECDVMLNLSATGAGSRGIVRGLRDLGLVGNAPKIELGRSLGIVGHYLEA